MRQYLKLLDLRSQPQNRPFLKGKSIKKPVLIIIWYDDDLSMGDNALSYPSSLNPYISLFSVHSFSQKSTGRTEIICNSQPVNVLMGVSAN